MEGLLHSPKSHMKVCIDLARVLVLNGIGEFGMVVGQWSTSTTTGTFRLVTKAVHKQWILPPQNSVDYALHSTRRTNTRFVPQSSR